jgi:hypothetical protein
MEDGGSWSEGQGPDGMAGGVHTTLIHLRSFKNELIRNSLKLENALV